MQGWLLWFALTAAFSLMGLSMAAWQGGMDAGGEMGTAHIGVAFTNYHGSNISSTQREDWDPPASASINRISEKELEIKIKNAYPGLEVKFWYQIENTGSLPVKITKHYVSSSCNQVYMKNDIGTLTIAVESSVGGDLQVEIHDVEELSNYTFSVHFEFEPDI